MWGWLVKVLYSLNCKWLTVFNSGTGVPATTSAGMRDRCRRNEFAGTCEWYIWYKATVYRHFKQNLFCCYNEWCFLVVCNSLNQSHWSLRLLLFCFPQLLFVKGVLVWPFNSMSRVEILVLGTCHFLKLEFCYTSSYYALVLLVDEFWVSDASVFSGAFCKGDIICELLKAN